MLPSFFEHRDILPTDLQRSKQIPQTGYDMERHPRVSGFDRELPEQSAQIQRDLACRMATNESPLCQFQLQQLEEMTGSKWIQRQLFILQLSII